jgi:hypothetical protein
MTAEMKGGAAAVRGRLRSNREPSALQNPVAGCLLNMQGYWARAALIGRCCDNIGLMWVQVIQPGDPFHGRRLCVPHIQLRSLDKIEQGAVNA